MSEKTQLVRSLLADTAIIESIRRTAYFVGKSLKWHTTEEKENLASDAITWALENAEKFPNRGDNTTFAFRNWMHGILRNTLKQYLRNIPPEVEYNDEIYTRDRLSIEAEVITDDAISALYDALPTKHQIAFSALIEGYSVDVAAQKARISNSDVVAIRKQLAECLQEVYVDEWGLLAPGCSSVVPVNYEKDYSEEPSAIDKKLAEFSEPPRHTKDKTPYFEANWFDAASPPPAAPNWPNVHNAEIREALNSTYAHKVEISRMVSKGDWQTPVPHYANLTEQERADIRDSRRSEQSKRCVVNGFSGVNRKH